MPSGVLKLCISLQGHTLRLLSLPDFLDASIGKILKVSNGAQRRVFPAECREDGVVSIWFPPWPGSWLGPIMDFLRLAMLWCSEAPRPPSPHLLHPVPSCFVFLTFLNLHVHQLKAKISSATSAVKSLFGQDSGTDTAVCARYALCMGSIAVLVPSFYLLFTNLRSVGK